ncbi:MAG: endonuclease/exonuclease/phosphatase family protein [Flavobacteriaceae bacterium]|nr:endonuclease/exonuclease/phosphatase family protein [Flavobacteriaceae bacterium]
MKKLSFVNKGIYFFNTIAAATLLISFALPYVEPKNFALLSVLSLAVPILLVLNMLFVVYWLLRLKKQLLLSLIVLLLGHNYLGLLYKFSGSKDIDSDVNINIMSFNVRLFNLYNWIDTPNIENDIVNFIEEVEPDVIAFQEYHPHKNVKLSNYNYKHEVLKGKRVRFGQAIFSKFPIINSGSVEFPTTANNAIFADIVKGNDTIRIYNVHLQSTRIDPNLEQYNTQDSERVLKGVKQAFKMQQTQAEMFLAHKEKSAYKTVICGDFNNTAYSYVYKEICAHMKDAFKEAGNGFGRTFAFKYFPLRIDFILVEEDLMVNGFKTYDYKFSDHFPMVAKVGLKL